MTGGYPPVNARTADGRLVGFDADLARSLASMLQAELVFVELGLPELLEAVRQGEVDLGLSGLTMTPRRNLGVPFAGPYYVARKSMVAAPEVLEGAENLEDLEGRGLRIVAIGGGTSEDVVRRRLPRAQHRFVKGRIEAIDLLLHGEADVFVADDPVARFVRLRHPEASLVLIDLPHTAEPLGIAIAPGDPLFVNLVENYLRNLEAIGVLDALRERWFERDDWLPYLE